MSFGPGIRFGTCMLAGTLLLIPGGSEASDVSFAGLLQLNAANVSFSGPSDLSSADTFHSLKVGLGGNWFDRVEAQAGMMVSAGGDVTLDDSYLSYGLSENTSVSFGHSKVYHTLSAATSETNGGLPERSIASVAFEVGTGGQLGAFFHSNGRNWSLQAGLSLDNLNANTAETDGWGIHARATYAPVQSETAFLHVALSAYHRDEVDDLLSLAAMPEAWLKGDNVFSSGLVEADSYRHANIEVAGSIGPWLLQVEYGGLHTNGKEVRSYDGGYVAASYVLTGEHRPYAADAGTIGALVPNHPIGKGGGAWEIAARYSRLDLRDRAQGNYGHTWTASLNWYPVENLRLMINTAIFKAGGDVSRKGHSIGIRMQLSR